MAFTAFALESTALYFQYGMGLQPCVLCVYERLATVGLFITGLIGALAPSSLIIRILALIVGLFSAIKGLMISIRHLDLQMNPAPWKQCEFLPNFPETLPLHKWLPAVFNPTGSCNESQWSLFRYHHGAMVGIYFRCLCHCAGINYTFASEEKSKSTPHF